MNVGHSNVKTYISNLVMNKAMTLEEKLALFLSPTEIESNLPIGYSLKEVHNFNGLCGYNFWEGDNLVGQISLGTLLSGTYVIYKRTFLNNIITESYDYYDHQGNFFYESTSLDGQCLAYTNVEMDLTNPFINHIYNVLAFEYDGTTFNYGNTNRIQFLEDYLNKLYRSKEIQLSVNDGIKDQVIKNIANEIIAIENDSVLKWSERQTIFKSLKEKRSKILSTKRRVHGFQYMLYDFVILMTDLSLKLKTFSQRPINNFFGSLYRYTLGNLFWFVGTVKSNLGYSVALAIYGPFTFYFITQPMNPHAMWAVGKVRNAYIKVERALTPEEPVEALVAKADKTLNEDSVSTKQAAPKRLVYPSKDISWDERMDNFKAMQIGYEEAMVFAERMGRIEQFETQLNFPLTAEAAWMELELYLNDVEGKIKYMKNLDNRLVKFLNNEKERTIELQFYIWQKLGQFYIDYPFIVVDEKDEQTQRNYYLGRQFVFFQKITERLSDLGIANSPKTHKNIEMLAEKFEKMKIEGSSVLDTLKKNSKVFQQKNYLSSDEHRDYMKRHWEVLFMQQNKKQEASSFSLQAYTWSIKNAMWLVQTIYSAKRSELWKLVGNYNLDNTAAPKNEADEIMNEYLANMFNNLVMEYVSVKKEMVENLPGDNEYILRENVINNIKAYLIERDKLFKTSVYASNDSDSNTI